MVLNREYIRNLSSRSDFAKKDYDGNYGLFDGIDEAVRAARFAHEEWIKQPLSKRGEIIDAFRKAVLAEAINFSDMAVKDTGLGNVRDKIKKHELVALKTPGIDILKPRSYTGDDGLTLVDMAPYGVIASITPCTNPTETVVNNGIGMAAAGNGVVFNAHPLAERVTYKAVELFNKISLSLGGPNNLFVGILRPTADTAKALMRHQGVNLIVVTGGKAVVDEAMSVRKKVIAAGPGNPPVVVDETAHLRQAAVSIVNGTSFDNNIVCVLEKELFVVESVKDELVRYMSESGAYYLSSYRLKQLEKLILKDGKPNRDYLGKDASLILKNLGIEVSEDIRLIIADTDKDHPFVVEEMLMPVLAVVSVKDVDAAIECAIEAEHGFHHSAIMHSTNIDNLHRMAKVMNTTIFIKNAPSYAGLGAGGEGYTSFTIATTTGEGLTTALTFSRERRCTLSGRFRIV